MREMLRYSWPGNVRELMNRVLSAVLMSDGPFIHPEDLGLGGEETGSEGPRESLREIRNRVERESILAALHNHGNNVSLASRDLGVTRTTLYALLKKYGISSGDVSAGKGSEALLDL